MCAGPYVYSWRLLVLPPSPLRALSIALCAVCIDWSPLWLRSPHFNDGLGSVV